MNTKFPRPSKLTEAEDFNKVFKGATRISSSGLTLLYKKNAHPFPRLGMAISIKHCGNAVVRNRVKRIIRETFRLQQSQMGNIDVVVLSKPRIKELNKQIIRKDLDRCWGKVTNSQ